MSEIPEHNSENLDTSDIPSEQQSKKPETTDLSDEKTREVKEVQTEVEKTSAEKRDSLKNEIIEAEIEKTPTKSASEDTKNEFAPDKVTDSKNETFATRFLGGFDMKGIMKKLGDFRNTLAFVAGSFISQIRELGFFKKSKMLDTISAFIGADRAQLAEAMKVHGFEGVTEKRKANMKSLMAVHKQKFSRVPVETFFLRVSENARKALKTQGSEATSVDFEFLTAVANGADFSDVEVKPEQPKAPEKTFVTQGDLLNESAPVKIDGSILSAKRSPAGFISSLEDGTSRSYTLLPGGADVKGLEIIKSSVNSVKKMDLVISYDGKEFTGKVPAKMVRNITRHQVATETAKITLQDSEGNSKDLTFQQL